MGQLALNIHNALGVIPAVPAAAPAQLLDGPELLGIFAQVEAAVSALELRAAGSLIRRGPGPPAQVLGNDLDLYVDTQTGDLWGKDAGAWGFLLNLKGGPGKDATGTAGLSAYQVAVQQGFTGSADQWLASLGRAGNDGKSAYLMAVAAGFAGSTDQWLAGLKGAPGAGGKDAVVGNGSVTNALLADDIKVGSLSAAANAYPAADRTGLTTIEKYLVWIGPKVTDLFTRIGNLDVSFGNVVSVVNGFTGRITALEARPAGGGTTAPTTAAATYPDQSATTTGLFLKSTGVASAQPVWAAVVNSKVGYVLSYKNEVSRTLRIFTETTVAKIQIDAGVSTLTYSVNGATAVAVVFTGNIYMPPANTPLVLAAGSLIAFSITYAAAFTEASFQLIGNETA